MYIQTLLRIEYEEDGMQKVEQCSAKTWQMNKRYLTKKACGKQQRTYRLHNRNLNNDPCLKLTKIGTWNELPMGAIGDMEDAPHSFQ